MKYNVCYCTECNWYDLVRGKPLCVICGNKRPVVDVKVKANASVEYMTIFRWLQAKGYPVGNYIRNK
jgi:hypothetical protein